MPLPDHHQLKNMLAVLALLFQALPSFVTLKFQGSSNSPLETHPVPFFLSIFALLLYCSLSLRLDVYAPRFATAWGYRFFRLLLILSFYFSIALLTLLLFPGPSILLLYLPILILLSVDRLYCLIQKLICLMQQKIPEFVFVRQLLGGRAPPLLPMTVADAHRVRTVVPVGAQLVIVSGPGRNLESL